MPWPVNGRLFTDAGDPKDSHWNNQFSQTKQMETFLIKSID